MAVHVNNLPHQQTRSTAVNDMEIENSKNNDSGTAQLVQLQSKDHEEILNVIDQLRSEGISKYVSLPQLIVCGDQSSGKSSVLEAITGLSFPTKDNVCTRFATELILRRAPNSGVTASIQPDPERALNQRERIRDFRSPTVALSQFAEIVSSAENFIGVGQDGHLFSKDVLRVEVSGPTQPHLTLVDLPGLYHASDEFQNEEGVKFVESLVLSYIRNKRSVILAIISAKSDIALQKVTAFTRKVDPQGARTMGIITKPDTLSETSDMERSFLNLARNVRVTFRLGWHVLKNRKYEERHFSLEQRREAESDFLASGVWSTLPRSQVGIDALRPRLSSILKDHIVSQVPGLILETQQAFEDTTTQLHKLGEARKTIVDQRRYLTHRSERFTALIGYAVNGVYFDPFFGDAMQEIGYLKRIRAMVQNCLADFSLVLTRRGEQRKIVDDLEAVEQDGAHISRTKFVEEVRQRQRRSRGQELIGTFNPLIIGDLFYLQSKPWEAITIECIDDLMENVLKTVMLILEDTVDEKSSRGLLELVITPSLEKIEKSLRSKTTELLRPQQLGHPITYNHSFTAAVQDARERHLRKSITKKLKEFFGLSYRENSFAPSSHSFRMDDLIGAIVSQAENDMESFACSEAVDCMQAYYEVARRKYVDDFSNLAVERCLLEPLSAIFRPQSVETLPEDSVRVIAEEEEESRLERHRLEEKTDVLQRSLTQLRRLDRHNFTAPKVLVHSSDGEVDVPSDAATSPKDPEVPLVDQDSDQGHASFVDGDEIMPPSPVPVIDDNVLQAPDDEDLNWSPKPKSKKKRHPGAHLFE